MSGMQYMSFLKIDFALVTSWIYTILCKVIRLKLLKCRPVYIWKDAYLRSWLYGSSHLTWYMLTVDLVLSLSIDSFTLNVFVDFRWELYCNCFTWSNNQVVVSLQVVVLRQIWIHEWDDVKCWMSWGELQPTTWHGIPEDCYKASHDGSWYSVQIGYQHIAHAGYLCFLCTCIFLCSSPFEYLCNICLCEIWRPGPSSVSSLKMKLCWICIMISQTILSPSVAGVMWRSFDIQFDSKQTYSVIGGFDLKLVSFKKMMCSACRSFRVVERGLCCERKYKRRGAIFPGFSM